MHSCMHAANAVENAAGRVALTEVSAPRRQCRVPALSADLRAISVSVRDTALP
jgi:hypothetical protein